jgi:hypothetical protein
MQGKEHTNISRANSGNFLVYEKPHFILTNERC